MGQAFSNSQNETNSNRDRPHADQNVDDALAWTSALNRDTTSSPSLSSRRRVLRSPLSSRGTRRPNPLRYEPPANSTPPPTQRLLTRLQQRLRRPHNSASETSSLVSPAESMMDVDSHHSTDNMSDTELNTLPEDSSMNAEVESSVTHTVGGDEENSQSTSALSRLLTEVITTAVLDSLNEDNHHVGRRQNAGIQEQQQEQTSENNDEDAEQEDDEEAGTEPNMTIQLPRELFGIPSEEENNTTNRSSLGSFFRMLRMPASTFRSNNSNNNNNNNNQSEQDETMPVFVIGYRASRSRPSANQEDEENQQGRRWVIYIISGGGNQLPASLFSDSPTYEDLLMLSHVLGPVRPVTATTEQVEAIPITVYRKDQMTEMINDKCQVCLEDYAELQELRMLQCKHGFHKECIDRWLTEGRNCCPICRGVPVPPASD